MVSAATSDTLAAEPSTDDFFTPSTTMRYAKGVKLHIQDHLPPDPFGGSYGPSLRDKTIFPEDGVIDRIAFALANPPLKTKPPSRRDVRTFTITGTKTLRSFETHAGGAHIVTGYLDQKTTPVYVAKIYDGVDYQFEAEGMDCMTLADKDYTVEGCAYEAMQSAAAVGGIIVPTYYGGWTFPLDTHNGHRQRWVRMILLELIEGDTMLARILRATRNDTIEYPLLPPEEFRLAVLKNIIEAEMTIWWEAEVQHIDLEPRNVMVRDDGRVVVIDFNHAMIQPQLELPHPKHEDNSQPPPSPIERYWPINPGGNSFANSEEDEGPWGNWIPQAWLKNKELAAEWLLETWGNPPPNKYEPLPEYFLQHWGHAERNTRILRALEKLGRKPAQENSK